MSIKVSVYIATSLDSYIARRDGSLDWLDEANAVVPEGEDCGFSAFMASIDALVMGRKTYEHVASFGEWPYGDTPVVVLSSNPIAFAPGIPETVTHSSGEPRDLLERLAAEGIQHVYVDGGTTIRGFLAARLVDEITITAIPVILGDGIPLFGPVQQMIRLTHIKTTAYEFGFVQSTYFVAK